MLCDRCNKNEAVYHIRQTVNGKTSELHLCAACGQTLNSEAEWPLQSLFGFGTAPARRQSAQPRYSCPVCGTTAEEIAESGYAGCSECYKVFARMYAPYISRLHGHVTHRGRTPFASDTAVQTEKTAEKPQSELEALKAELADAIKKEEFEKAATLRDKIKEKEGGK